MSDMKENGLGPMSLWDKIFVSKKSFLISNVIAIICFLYDAYVVICSSSIYKIFSLVSIGVLVVLLFFMRYCSQKHRDNATKSIIGVLLGVIYAYDLRFFDWNHENFSTIGIVFGAIKIALGIALIVLYILARSSKKSNYKLIISVRVAFAIVAVFAILNKVPYYTANWGDLQWFIYDITETLAFICTYFSVVCATGAVDRYKMIRDYYTGIGKWTEERRQETKEELFGK